MITPKMPARETAEIVSLRQRYDREVYELRQELQAMRERLNGLSEELAELKAKKARKRGRR